MLRLCCRDFTPNVDFTTDYQPWVVANFSGILCVDEVYQGDLALLLAVDPAAPDGDRLVGYTLLANTKAVDQSAIKAFSPTCGRPASNPTIRVCIRPRWPRSGQRLHISCVCSTLHVGWSEPPTRQRPARRAPAISRWSRSCSSRRSSGTSPSQA